MIYYVRGNLLDAKVEALVNPVNVVGVMGKGVALLFKQRFRQNYQDYKKACDSGAVVVGKVFVTKTNTESNPKWIINFPTKQHWKDPSQLEWITLGLKDLRDFIIIHGIKSIAVPALGCGNGKLDWTLVKQEIETAFSHLEEVTVFVYLPSIQ